MSTLLEHFNKQSPVRRAAITVTCALVALVGILWFGDLVAPKPIACGEHMISAQVKEGYGFQATLEDALAQGGYDQVENLIAAAQQVQDEHGPLRRGDTVTACLEQGDKRIAIVDYTQIVG